MQKIDKRRGFRLDMYVTDEMAEYIQSMSKGRTASEVVRGWIIAEMDRKQVKRPKDDAPAKAAKKKVPELLPMTDDIFWECALALPGCNDRAWWRQTIALNDGITNMLANQSPDTDLNRAILAKRTPPD